MEIIFSLYVIACLILLLFHFKKNKGIIYLIYAIFIHGLRQLQLNVYLNSANVDDYIFWMPILNFHILPIVLASPSFLYLYLKSVETGKLYWKRSTIIHLIPSLLIGINYIPYFITPYSEKIAFYMRQIKIPNGPTSMNLNLFLNDNVCKVLPMLMMLVYFVIMTWEFKIFKKEKELSAQQKKIKKFASFMLIFYVINWIPYALIFMYSAIQLGHENLQFVFKNEYLPNISILTFWATSVPISLFLLPSFTYNYQLDFIKSTIIFKTFKKVKKEKTIEQNEVPEEFSKIIKFMNENVYNVNFNINIISHALNIPQARISSLLKIHMGTSFPKYKNKLRIIKSIELINNNEHKNLSIEGIAIKAGFKNKSTFYIAFKDEYGITPLDWIKKEKLAFA